MSEHKAGRRVQRAAGGIFVGVAGLEMRLFSHDTRSVDFVDLTVLVSDMPIAIDESNGNIRVIRDHDLVAPDVAVVIRVGLFFEIIRINRHLDIPCQSTIHTRHTSIFSLPAYPTL